MVNIQKQMEKFHKNIKVESGELREKRNIILDKIKKSLFEDKKPVPSILNQGSYIYGVGIKPVSEEDYDIDVGLDFNIKTSDYDPKEVRKWVYSAIEKHTNNVENKGPCIRVIYQLGFHVDLVCYARYKDDNLTENFHLAHKNSSWIASDPKKIKNYIENARESFKNTKDSSGSDQLQRVVRYIKKWNDLIYPNESNNKPIGLAILLYCIETLQSSFRDSQGNSDDLQALITTAEKAMNSDNRIIADKPDTQEDIFNKISDLGMKKLISNFKKLHKNLLDARNSDYLKDSCEIMRKLFGNDFPLEESNTESKKNKKAFLTSIANNYKPIKPYGKTE